MFELTFLRTTPGNSSTISPKFETNYASVVAASVGNVAAPNATRDVAYLELRSISKTSNLADTIFRLDTYGGQPPTSVSGAKIHQAKRVR